MKPLHSGKQGFDRDFLQLIGDLARSGQNAGEVFADFLELAFCAVAKTTTGDEGKAAALEERYMRIAKERGADYLAGISKLLGITVLALAEKGHGDFLGRVSGEIGVLNEYQGQFFTPYELSKMMALMSLQDVGQVIERNGYVTIQEPAVGAAGMLMAAAEVIDELGFDSATQMFAVGIDVSPQAVKMAFLQCAFAKVPAIIIHGNTLSLEEWGRYATPAAVAFVAARGNPFKSQSCHQPAMPKPVGSQLDLFA